MTSLELCALRENFDDIWVFGKKAKTILNKGHYCVTQFSFRTFLCLFMTLSKIISAKQPSILPIVHFGQKLAKFITADNLNGCHKCTATDVWYPECGDQKHLTGEKVQIEKSI